VWKADEGVWYVDSTSHLLAYLGNIDHGDRMDISRLQFYLHIATLGLRCDGAAAMHESHVRCIPLCEYPHNLSPSSPSCML
jgi:hypothetical protein